MPLERGRDLRSPQDRYTRPLGSRFCLIPARKSVVISDSDHVKARSGSVFHKSGCGVGPVRMHCVSVRIDS